MQGDRAARRGQVEVDGQRALERRARRDRRAGRRGSGGLDVERKSKVFSQRHAVLMVGGEKGRHSYRNLRADVGPSSPRRRRVHRRRHDPSRPCVLPGFRWFVASVLTMAMGAQIQGVVVAWQMYAITHDPLSLGHGRAGRGGAVHRARAAAPGTSRTSLDRRRVALMALVRAAAVRAGAGGGQPSGARTGVRRPSLRWRSTRVIVVCGAARSFLLPARNALGAEVVPRVALLGVGRLAHRRSGRSPPSRARRWAACSTAGSAPAAAYVGRGGADGGGVRRRVPHPRRARARAARAPSRCAPACARASPSSSRAPVPGRDDAGPVRGAVRRRGRASCRVRRGDPARRAAGAGRCCARRRRSAPWSCRPCWRCGRRPARRADVPVGGGRCSARA